MKHRNVSTYCKPVVMPLLKLLPPTSHPTTIEYFDSPKYHLLKDLPAEYVSPIIQSPKPPVPTSTIKSMKNSQSPKMK